MQALIPPTTIILARRPIGTQVEAYGLSFVLSIDESDNESNSTKDEADSRAAGRKLIEYEKCERWFDK